MKKKKEASPPAWAQRLLEWYCRAEVLEDLQGDLNEYFKRNCDTKGKSRAQLIYVIDVIKFFRLYTIKKPKPSHVMHDLIILGNYFKTSTRNIQRNKLFSAINIVGLAVSMCVGLLLIALITELKSFDNFHRHAERIYRVNSILQESNGSRYNYATTSLLTAHKLKETVSGIEQMVIMRRGFNKDIHYENKVIPLRGFWADASFFSVFSFEVVSGNAATALAAPNSVVLTESAAIRLFGDSDASGRSVQIDSATYNVTAIVKDPSLNSHMHFDILGSFVTIDQQKLVAEQDQNWLKWDDMWDNYIYILLPQKNNIQNIEKNLAQISNEGNETIRSRKINLYLEPLREIVLTRNMSHPIGPTVDRSIVVTFGILALIVIISACFNYTNLSIARALRRTREVGIRKAIGATRRQVFIQFILESIILSLLSLAVAFVLFIVIKKKFIEMDGSFQEMVTLQPTVTICLYFVGLAVGIGILAGLMPSSFFSKLNTAMVLKDISSLKLFGRVNLRKALIIFQYTLSILFIVVVSIGYKQYRYSIAFDLGFQTENILIVDLQQNISEPIIKELSEIPEVKTIAKASLVSSVGANHSGNVKYKDPSDSAVINYNFVDHEYIPLYHHQILAGKNFNPALAENRKESGIIVNRHTIDWMQLSDPYQAIGEELIIDGRKYLIIGVVEDFHHERVNYPIRNFAFRFDPERFEVLSLKIESDDLPATMDKVNTAWKKIDNIHPLNARFYEEHIEQAYNKLSWIMKIIGSVAFLSISIASMGLLGMVIFTTETRLKEISIRKVLGASELSLVFMMGRGFISLLIISCLIGLPCAYYFMDNIILGSIVYRAPIGVLDLFIGIFAIIGIAFLMIGSQTIKVARTNPAEVLKVE